MMNLCVVIPCCLLSMAANPPQPVDQQTADEPESNSIAFVENSLIRVGITLEWGGAITHVSVPGGPNIINSHDLGRQIQQSYYSGPANYQREGKRKSSHWASFPWNPIQTGDAFRNGSQVLEHRVIDNELYVKTIPKLWPMENDPGECSMETWITLLPGGSKFSYRARLTNSRSDKVQYGAHNQEIPAVYVNGPWHKLMAYTGDMPFTGEAVSEMRNGHKEPWPWVNYLPTEGWAALVNEDGTGIGVCVPRPIEFHGGFAGQRGHGDEKSANTGYMSPITTEILDHNIVYEYNCTFVVGSLDDIRAEAKRLAPAKLPSWNFSKTRKGWHFQNGSDAGWPLSGKGLTAKSNVPGKLVRFVGPFTFWRAETAPIVRIRISSGSSGAMRIYWRGMPSAAASTKPSLWNAWRRTWFQISRSTEVEIKKGSFKWLTVQLSERPNYVGGITGLALDIPDGVAIHDIALVSK